jgi:hypothetical protein
VSTVTGTVDTRQTGIIFVVVADWRVLKLRHDCLKSRLCTLSLGATVYNLWKHTNYILHGNVLSSEEMIIAKIKWEIRARIMAKGPYKKTSMKYEKIQINQLFGVKRAL